MTRKTMAGPGAAALGPVEISQALTRPGPDASSDFDLNPSIKARLAPGRKRTPAAVLIALVDGASGPQVVLTRRSDALRHHPGQIALPGGKQDHRDQDAVATALRESHEEVGLPPGNVRVLGEIAPHETVTGFVVTPVIGWVSGPFVPVPELGEVEDVFLVPLQFLISPDNYQIHSRVYQGIERRYWSVPYGPYYIWGATARILQTFAQQLVHTGTFDRR